MIKLNKLLLFIYLLSTIYPCYGYQLSICCIFQDDAKYLPEWIEFHKDRGVEHFYLYNNLSQDNYQEVLKPYVESGLVELFEWPFSYNKESQWTIIQCLSYMDCIYKIKDRDKWCAFLDSDEFLFSPSNHDIKTTLKEYEDCSSIGVNWVMYGTSNVDKIPDFEPIRNHLVMRSRLDFNGNEAVKSIVQPKYVENCTNPHFFVMKKGHGFFNENRILHNPTCTMKNSVNKLRINHYWTRDQEFFYKEKLERRKKWGGQEEVKRVIEVEKILNEIFDPIISDSQEVDIM